MKDIEISSNRTWDDGSSAHVFKVSVGYGWFAITKDEHGWTRRIGRGWSLSFNRAWSRANQAVTRP